MNILGEDSPGVSLQCFLKPSTPSLRRAGITKSYEGSSLMIKVRWLTGNDNLVRFLLPIDSFNNLSALFQHNSKFLRRGLFIT